MCDSGRILESAKQQISCLTSYLFSIFLKASVDEGTLESLAIYLHELGDILYYPDEKELKDTIIIKPAWVSKHIARVLDSPIISKQGGFLSKPLMQQLWHDIESHWHDKFITLMETFDLSYRTGDEQRVCLIVEKLSYEEHPDYLSTWKRWEGQREITFKYQLDTIPAGIPTWFIARTHRFTLYIHWRYGVLLQDKSKQHLAFVIARPEQKEVWLKVRGPMPYYFFAQLRDTLELTLNRFEGLGRTVSVPCPGHNGLSCSHHFNLKHHLEQRLLVTPPRNTIECPVAMESVSVIKMLFGLSFAPDNIPLVAQITRHVEKVLDQKFNKMEEHFKELAKFIQLEFLKSYHFQQAIMDQTCPNLFTLKPKKSKLLTRALEADEFELQLYCQMPGRLHPVRGGCYLVKIPKMWFTVIARYHNKVLRLLKRIAPIILPGTQAVIGDTLLDSTKNEIGILRDYIDQLNNIQLEGEHFSKEVPHSIRAAKGGELRIIRQLLIAADKDHYWGNLHRKVTPEGHILWLCPEHIEEYK